MNCSWTDGQNDFEWKSMRSPVQLFRNRNGLSNTQQPIDKDTPFAERQTDFG